MSASLTSAATAAAAASRERFRRFSWGVLGWNVIVVLWGAYVRATGSGAGCGSHWPLCNGEVVPRSPQAATMIEFTHRITSGLALAAVVLLVWWAFRLFSRGHLVRRAAMLSLVLIVVEALLGAGLVLLEYVAQNASLGRAVYLSAHLTNTQLLLAALAMTAWFSAPRGPVPAIPAPRLLFAALPVSLVISVSGAVAALGDTLFPATSFAAGVREELSSAAHVLLRLRLAHPAMAIIGGAFIVFVTYRLMKTPALRVLAAWSTMLVLIQLCAGAINVALLAPVWMQIVHLLLADALWVVLILLLLKSREAGSDIVRLQP